MESYDFNLKGSSEQLKEINGYSLGGVQFYAEGPKVRPKSLHVVKILRNRIGRNMSFTRFFKYSSDLTLPERISLSSDEFQVQEFVYEPKRSQNTLFPELNQLMYNFTKLINVMNKEVKSSLKSHILNISQTLASLQGSEGIKCSSVIG